MWLEGVIQHLDRTRVTGNPDRARIVEGLRNRGPGDSWRAFTTTEPQKATSYFGVHTNVLFAPKLFLYIPGASS